MISAAIDAPETLGRFRELIRFPPVLGHEQVVLEVRRELRPQYRWLALSSNQLSATSSAGELGLLLDEPRKRTGAGARARFSCRKEPETLAWLEEFAIPGAIFYDRAYSLVAAAMGCRVFCFEPSYPNYHD